MNIDNFIHLRNGKKYKIQHVESDSESKKEKSESESESESDEECIVQYDNYICETIIGIMVFIYIVLHVCKYCSD